MRYSELPGDIFKRAIKMCIPYYIANKNRTTWLKEAKNLHDSVETRKVSKYESHLKYQKILML